MRVRIKNEVPDRSITHRAMIRQLGGEGWAEDCGNRLYRVVLDEGDGDSYLWHISDLEVICDSDT